VGQSDALDHARVTLQRMRQILRGGPVLLSVVLLSFGLNIFSLTLSILFFGEMYERSRAKGVGRLRYDALRQPIR
jgi:hypothetical protein